MIFLDLDGVLADFDTAHERAFGYRPTRWPQDENANWKGIETAKDFYLHLPLMPGSRDLFGWAVEISKQCGYQPPTILTGIPVSVDAAANNKRRWVATYFGPNVSVICCRSRDKYKHGKPGDFLVDDYLKYRAAWLGMGGFFIHYTDAVSAIKKLKDNCYASLGGDPRAVRHADTA